MNYSPKPEDYYMPAEWAARWGTLLSWPHNTETWPNERLSATRQVVTEFARLLAEDETVCINATGDTLADAKQRLQAVNANLNNIRFFSITTNDAWCRDHGPIFVLHKALNTLALLNWEYNAWGGKYPPFDADNAVPLQVAQLFPQVAQTFSPGIVLEGGSIEPNGEGVLLTTRSCLLKPNRNPHLNQKEIEEYLYKYLGVQKIIWLEDGIEGDDTDGHIDDLSRFVNANTIISIIPDDPQDSDYPILKENFEQLKSEKNLDGKPFNIITLPTLAEPLIDEGQRLPASYANFYIGAKKVIVPIFGDVNDMRALELLQLAFPTRAVIGLNCKAVVWGLGTLHCLSQQVPAHTLS